MNPTLPFAFAFVVDAGLLVAIALLLVFIIVWMVFAAQRINELSDCVGITEEERLRENWTTTHEREEAAKDFESRLQDVVDDNILITWLHVMRKTLGIEMTGTDLSERDDLGLLLGFKDARTEMDCIIRCDREDINDTAGDTTVFRYWRNSVLPRFDNSAKEYFSEFSQILII